MAKAKQPVTIGGISFDALMSEERSYSAEIPQYTIDSGFAVSDAILIGADTVNMTLFVTDTPVTWKDTGGVGHAEETISKLEDLYYKREPVEIVTTEKTYTDMGISSMSVSKSTDIGYAKEVKITLQKIRTTAVSTTTIPDSYGKAGASKSASGTAGTKVAEAGTTKNAAASSSKGSTKSSILYSAASSIGLI